MSHVDALLFVGLVLVAQYAARRICAWGAHWSVTLGALVGAWWVLTYLGHRLGLG